VCTILSTYLVIYAQYKLVIQYILLMLFITLQNYIMFSYHVTLCTKCTKKYRMHVHEPLSLSLNRPGRLTDLSHPSLPSHTLLLSIEYNFVKMRYCSCRIQLSQLHSIKIISTIINNVKSIIITINIINVRYRVTKINIDYYIFVLLKGTQDQDRYIT